MRGMKTRVFAIFIGALMVSLWANGAAPGKTRVFGYSLEYRLKEKGESQYNKLLMALSKRGLSFELTIQPMTRIIRDLESHNQCVFPTSVNSITTFIPAYEALSLIASKPVDYISMRVFSRPGEPVIKELSQLRGKTIAVWSGMDVEVFLSGMNVEVETTPSELIRAKMLDKGRIDAILGFIPDVVLAAEQLDLPTPQYEESLALFRGEGASMVCHDTPANRNFIDQFNREISALKASGELRKILGPHVKLTP